MIAFYNHHIVITDNISSWRDIKLWNKVFDLPDNTFMHFSSQIPTYSEIIQTKPADVANMSDLQLAL